MAADESWPRFAALRAALEADATAPAAESDVQQLLALITLEGCPPAEQLDDVLTIASKLPVHPASVPLQMQLVAQLAASAAVKQVDSMPLLLAFTTQLASAVESEEWQNLCAVQLSAALIAVLARQSLADLAVMEPIAALLDALPPSALRVGALAVAADDNRNDYELTSAVMNIFLWQQSASLSSWLHALLLALRLVKRFTALSLLSHRVQPLVARLAESAVRGYVRPLLDVLLLGAQDVPAAWNSSRAALLSALDVLEEEEEAGGDVDDDKAWLVRLLATLAYHFTSELTPLELSALQARLAPYELPSLEQRQALLAAAAWPSDCGLELLPLPEEGTFPWIEGAWTARLFGTVNFAIVPDCAGEEVSVVTGFMPRPPQPQPAATAAASADEAVAAGAKEEEEEAAAAAAAKEDDAKEDDAKEDDAKHEEEEKATDGSSSGTEPPPLPPRPKAADVAVRGLSAVVMPFVDGMGAVRVHGAVRDGALLSSLRMRFSADGLSAAGRVMTGHVGQTVVGWRHSFPVRTSFSLLGDGDALERAVALMHEVDAEGGAGAGAGGGGGGGGGGEGRPAWHFTQPSVRRPVMVDVEGGGKAEELKTIHMRGRDGAALATVGEDLYVIGGATAAKEPPRVMITWVRAGGSWMVVPPSDGAAPPPRSRHAVAVAGDRVWMWGGQRCADRQVLAELWCYGVDVGLWRQLPAQAPWPQPSFDAGLIAADDTLYLFGGCSYASLPHSELWAYDMPTATWQQIDDCGQRPPPPRYGTAFTAASGSLLLFGGHSSLAGAELPPSNELWRRDDVSLPWRRVEDAAGRPPRARSWAGVASAAGAMFLFGGRGVSGVTGRAVLLNDLWRYDPVNNSWSELLPSAIRPSPRYRAALAVTDSGSVLVLAGLRKDKSGQDEAASDGWAFALSETQMLLGLEADDEPCASAAVAPMVDGDAAEAAMAARAGLLAPPRLLAGEGAAAAGVAGAAGAAGAGVSSVEDAMGGDDGLPAGPAAAHGDIYLLEFDGIDGHVLLGGETELAFGGSKSYTAEAWVYPNRHIGTQFIVGKFNKFLRGTYYMGVTNSGTLIGQREVAPWNMKSDAVLPARRWSHVAMVYDGKKLDLVINGSLDKSVPFPAQAVDELTPVTVGAAHAHSSPGMFAFSGYIAELRLWNSPRSPAQLRDGMNGALRSLTLTQAASLVGYWPMTSRSCSSLVAPDRSRGRRHGLLRGGVVWRRHDVSSLPWLPVAAGVSDVAAPVGTCSARLSSPRAPLDVMLTGSSGICSGLLQLLGLAPYLATATPASPVAVAGGFSASISAGITQVGGSNAALTLLLTSALRPPADFRGSLGTDGVPHSLAVTLNFAGDGSLSLLVTAAGSDGQQHELHSGPPLPWASVEGAAGRRGAAGDGVDDDSPSTREGDITLLVSYDADADLLSVSTDDMLLMELSGQAIGSRLSASDAVAWQSADGAAERGGFARPIEGVWATVIASFPMLRMMAAAAEAAGETFSLPPGSMSSLDVKRWAFRGAPPPPAAGQDGAQTLVAQLVAATGVDAETCAEALAEGGGTYCTALATLTSRLLGLSGRWMTNLWGLSDLHCSTRSGKHVQGRYYCGSGHTSDVLLDGMLWQASDEDRAAEESLQLLPSGEYDAASPWRYMALSFAPLQVNNVFVRLLVDSRLSSYRGIWHFASSTSALTATKVDTTMRQRVGRSGLVNLGNSCYMNSLLQALFMTDDLRRLVFASPPKDSDTEVAAAAAGVPAPPSLPKQFYKLFRFMRHTLRASYSPLKFRATLPEFWRTGMQQDAGEFGNYIINQLESAFLGSKELLEGELVNVIQCQSCGYMSSRSESFYTVNYGFPTKYTAVTDIALVSGSSASVQPPEGFTKVPVDLNMGSGGDYLYLCFKRDPEGTPIVELDILCPEVKEEEGDGGAVTVEELDIPDGFQVLEQNLNPNCAKNPMFLAFRRGFGAPIDDLDVLATAGSEPQHALGFTRLAVDLNRGAGGKYVFICFSRNASPITDVQLLVGDAAAPDGYELAAHDFSLDRADSVSHRLAFARGRGVPVTDMQLLSGGDAAAAEAAAAGFTCLPLGGCGAADGLPYTLAFRRGHGCPLTALETFRAPQLCPRVGDYEQLGEFTLAAADGLGGVWNSTEGELALLTGELDGLAAADSGFSALAGGSERLAAFEVRCAYDNDSGAITGLLIPRDGSWELWGAWRTNDIPYANVCRFVFNEDCTEFNGNWYHGELDGDWNGMRLDEGELDEAMEEMQAYTLSEGVRWPNASGKWASSLGDRDVGFTLAIVRRVTVQEMAVQLKAAPDDRLTGWLMAHGDGAGRLAFEGVAVRGSGRTDFVEWSFEADLSRFAGSWSSASEDTRWTAAKDCYVSLGIKKDYTEKWADGRQLFTSRAAGETLDALTDAFSCPQVMDGGDRYLCSGCDVKRVAHRFTVVRKPPRHLIVTLKRFTFDYRTGVGGKVVKKLDYPCSYMLPYVAADGDDPLRCGYGLYAVVFHRGGSANSGHYYTYARRSGDTAGGAEDVEGNPWYRLDDQSVKVAKWEDVRRNRDTAYMLFYRRLDAAPLGTEELGDIAEEPDIPVEVTQDNCLYYITEMAASSSPLLPEAVRAYTAMLCGSL